MRRPKVLVTGAQGQVGHELAHLLGAHADVVAVDRAALDLADPAAIVSAMRASRPDIVVNAGAYTAVDAAERERDAAFAVNARAPQVLADEAKRANARPHPLLDRLRLRRRRDDALRRGRADGAAQRLRAEQARGRAGDRGERRARARAAHELGVRTARQEFPADDPPPGGRARRAADRRRPDGHAELGAHARAGDRRPGRARPRVPGRARGPLSPELDGRDDVARLRDGDRRRRRPVRASCRSAAPSTPRPRAGPRTACWRRPAFAPRSASSCRSGGMRWPPVWPRPRPRAATEPCADLRVQPCSRTAEGSLRCRTSVAC